MENWLIYGLLIAIFFGTSAIAAKVATSNKFYGIPPATSSLLMLAGIAIVFVAAFILQGKFEVPSNAFGSMFGILSGVLWALGFSLLFFAISQGTDVAKLAPIVGINIMITVLLGIFLLKEAQVDMVKIVAGAILITVGTMLVA